MNKIFQEGQLISVQGYIYEVLRGAGNFYTLKWQRVDNDDDVPRVKRKRLKKGDSFSINAHRLHVIGVTASLWFRIRVKELSNEEIRILEKDLGVAEEEEAPENGREDTDLEPDTEGSVSD